MFVDLAKPFSKVTWTLRILQTMIASKLAIGNSNATLAIQMCDDTVDGSKILRSPVEVGSLSHYFQGFCTSPMVHDFSHQAPVDWVRLATWHDGVGRLLTIERHKCPFIQSEKKSPLPKKHRRMRGAWMNTTCFMYMYFRYNETNLYFSEGLNMSCSPLSTRIRWTSAGGFGFGCMGFLWRSLGRSSSEDALVLFCSIFAWLGSSLHSNCTTLPSNLRGSERAQCFRFRFWIPQ